MKNILRIALAALFVLCSCSKEEEKESYLQVNRNNISGEWTLSKWNGKPLAEGSFFHITLVRNDGTFTMEQNMDAFPNGSREITGSYDLAVDAYDRSIISGMYDFDSGYWSHDYYIEKLTPESMEWVAVDDPGFVQIFVRR